MQAWIAEQANRLAGRRLTVPLRIVRDTTDFMGIDRDAVLVLEGELYLPDPGPLLDGRAVRAGTGSTR